MYRGIEKHTYKSYKTQVNHVQTHITALRLHSDCTLVHTGTGSFQPQANSKLPGSKEFCPRFVADVTLFDALRSGVPEGCRRKSRGEAKIPGMGKMGGMGKKAAS